MQKQYKLTRESMEKLEKELDYLKTVREREVAELIKEARSFGDLSENSEYDEAKNEQGKVFSKIAELENILSNAVLISDDSYRLDEASIGLHVLVRDIETKEEEKYQIVGARDSNPVEGKISDESPVGRALVGKKVGEIVTVEVPVGEIKYEILKIWKETE
ncbi:MAG: transcription elongation factor GreA [Clostridiales bacterium]|nr:transcription elongation factor GreA [Clostridiales bacterium]